MTGEANDIVIIGAGPAGLSAGLFARARGLRATVLEAGMAGGQLTALFPEKPLYNVPALASSLAREYAGDLIRHARDEGIELHEGETVYRLQKDEAGTITAVCDDRLYCGKATIVATGMGRMTPRLLGVEGEAGLAGRQLVYAVTDPQSFAGQRVLVVGGGDAAVDNALLLSGIASSVALAHRSAAFKAQQRRLDMLPERGVDVLTDIQVKELQDTGAGLRARLIHAPDGAVQDMDVDRVVVNIGIIPNPGPLAEWGLCLEGKLIKVDSEMKTNLPGVFACGDAVAYPGKLKMVVTAIGEAATAVNSAYQYLKARA